MRRYPFPAHRVRDINEGAIRRFFQDYKEGKIPPELKSEPDPEQNHKVYTIVGDTWKKVTQDPKKDVFVMVYSAEC